MTSFNFNYLAESPLGVEASTYELGRSGVGQGGGEATQFYP